jgi:hypothetical protein
VVVGDEEMLFPLSGDIASARDLFRNVPCVALDCTSLLLFVVFRF